MIQLATPISTLFERDPGGREIVSRSCCLECREHTLAPDLDRQFLFHFDRDLTLPWDEKTQDMIAAYLEVRPELKLLSFHVSSCCSRPVLRDGMFHCGGDEFFREELLEHGRQNVLWLKDHLKDRPIEIAVENNNYYPTSAYRHVTDADFISEVVCGNDIRFLYDIAHGRITAHNKGEPYGEYRSGLPMDRLIQIHVSRHAVNDQGMAFDAHLIPDEETFAEVRELVEEFRPKYLSIEYYRDKDQLVRVLEQYRVFCSDNENSRIVN